MCRVAAILWLQFMVHVMLFTVIKDLCCYNINTVLNMYSGPKICLFSVFLDFVVSRYVAQVLSG